MTVRRLSQRPRGGSGNNPYLKANRSVMEYNVLIEPQQIAKKLMQVTRVLYVYIYILVHALEPHPPCPMITSRLTILRFGRTFVLTLLAKRWRAFLGMKMVDVMRSWCRLSSMCRRWASSYAAVHCCLYCYTERCHFVLLY